MKTIVAFFLGMSITYFFCVITLKPDEEPPTIVLSEHQADCFNRGGEYSLNIEASGEVYYEWCEIDEKIDYSNPNI